ncbi:hypothetical protein IQ07DRAFT_639713 [Pyrenochaeta sp. DS3sAY3a]|nr:hypothetical protein IQ07DRAFT_639713 [Pyrenochaeta sp. DS3sAY3a]
MRITKAFSSHRIRIGMTNPKYGRNEVWLEVIPVKDGSQETSRLYTHPELKGPLYHMNQFRIDPDTFTEEIMASTVAKSIEKARDLWKEKFGKPENTSNSSSQAFQGTKREGSSIPDNDSERNKKVKLMEDDFVIDEDRLLLFVSGDVVKRWHDLKLEQNMEDHRAMMIGLQKYFGTVEEPPMDVMIEMRAKTKQEYAGMLIYPDVEGFYSQPIWTQWIGDAKRLSSTSLKESEHETA